MGDLPNRNSATKGMFLKQNSTTFRLKPQDYLVRRRVWARWKRPIFLVTMATALISSLGSLCWWLYQSGKIEKTTTQAIAYYAELNRSAGLVLNEVFVTGRRETSEAQLLKALRVNRGDPILAFDVDAARRRLEAIEWIESARIERHLPDTIYVSILERRPVAVWQRKGTFVLIDGSGTVIGTDGIERFTKLKIVVGTDAPNHTQALISMMKQHPALMARVKAAVRSGGRRWNLQLHNGIDIQLPEINPSKAWDRLAQYEEKHNLLGRNISRIDLRVPNRVIVKLQGNNYRIKQNGGRRT